MTFSVAPKLPRVSVRAMVPVFVNPLANVRLPAPSELFPWTRNVAPAAFETLPLMLPVPLAVTAPWLTNGALMTLDAGFNTVLVATVSVPVPLQVVLVMLSAADAVLKSCAAETDVAESASLPPLIVPLS